MATSDDNGFLDSVIAAHGGLDNWNSLTKIEVNFTFFGAVLNLKGYHSTRRPSITIFAHAHKQPSSTAPWSVMQNLSGDPAEKWYFNPRRVWIESADGTLRASRENPRESLLSRPVNVLSTSWDDLDLLYFMSYVMFNYVSIPFNLTYPGFTVTEPKLEAPYTEFGETWRVFEVQFPTDSGLWPTPCPVQRFYFGEEDKLLKRMDYTTDVLGGVASHCAADPKAVGKWTIESFRRVVSRAAKTSGLYDTTDVAFLGKRTGFPLNFDEVKAWTTEGEVKPGV